MKRFLSGRKSLVALGTAAVLAAFGLGASSCSNSLTEGVIDSAAKSEIARSVINGSNGSLIVNNMSNGNLTVTYNAGSQKVFARLFVSEGNGAGLVLANKDMDYSNGVYSYTLSHPTFTNGASIYVGLLVNDNGVEKVVPQGTLSSTTSWSKVTYGSDTSTGSPVVGTEGIVSGNTYTLVAKCSGKALDADGWSTADGGNIHQWTLGDNQANQQWVITQDGNGYKIVNKHSNRALDVAEWSTADGGNVHQWAYGGQDNQKWNFERLDDGYYKITSVYSGKVLDVSAASVDNGANVQQWTWNASDAQRWQVKQVGDSNVIPEPIGGGNPIQVPVTGDIAVTDAGTLRAQYNSLPRPTNGTITMTFENTTNGKFKDSEVFVLVVYQIEGVGYCWGRPDGSYKKVGANESCADYSYAISYGSGNANGNNGFLSYQIPTSFGARIFYSYGSKMSIKGSVDGYGVVFPSLANPSDPDYNKYYDWLEYTVRNDGCTWINTTQVDQFGFPALITAYNADGTWLQTGVTLPRDEVYKQYKAYTASKGVSADFDKLCTTYRIVCPAKYSEFNQHYLDGYINQVWSYWQTHTGTVKHPQGLFTLTSDGNNLYFYCQQSYNPGMCTAGTTYTIHGKPTTANALEGSGCLASGNPMEAALEAWVCAALNRHVADQQIDSAWTYTAFPAPESYKNSYYKAGPANFYSGFWHEISSNNGLAYGFCYDDVMEQSSTTVATTCQKVWVRLGF